MPRGILIVLLSLGVIAGYASAFFGWRSFGYPRHPYAHWEERHWARLCAEAAREAAPAPPSHSDAPTQGQR
jgi:hypothetical protein